MPEVSTQAILELLDRKGVESVPILKYFTEDLLPVKSDSKISLRKLKELFETPLEGGPHLGGDHGQHSETTSAPS
ncbi:MAG: hypothetical protein QFX37_07325 [Archaeoglobales archaeon]|nr:hypothetical protein [Archaeoglobales archaeon]